MEHVTISLGLRARTGRRQDRMLIHSGCGVDRGAALLDIDRDLDRIGCGFGGARLDQRVSLTLRGLLFEPDRADEEPPDRETEQDCGDEDGPGAHG